MKILSKLSILTCALTLTLPALAQDTLELKTEKISDSVYMLSGVGKFTGGNIGLSIGDDGVAMIDNGIPDLLDVLKAEIAKTTDKPIDYLINTHAHGDHTGNNVSFGGAGSRIISHQNLRRSLLNKNIDSTGLPVLTFNDQMTIHINGDAAKIMHFANAHTDGDGIVFFEQANVIHTGDIMFNGVFPFIDSSNGGSAVGMIAALKGIAEIANDDTKIIPGHGPLATKADVISSAAIIEDGLQIVSNMVADGKSDEEIKAANPLAAYESFGSGFISTDRMIDQLIHAAR